MLQIVNPAGQVPAPYALADWRRRINDLYAAIRAEPSPLAAWHLWHETRGDLFRSHPMSPLSASQKAAFGGISVYDYDPGLRFAVDLIPQDGPALDYDLGPDGSMRARPIAQTAGLGEALGGELTLYWIEGYGGGLFLPFRDATAGTETYGGGRYAIDAIKGADLGPDAAGRLIIDFNFACNPSCAVNPAYICPLTPPENTLPAPVRAGERDV